MTDTGKSEWPELTGVDVDRARGVIEADRPDVRVQPVGMDHVVTMDYRTDRVWLWHDPVTGLVVRAPRIG